MINDNEIMSGAKVQANELMRQADAKAKEMIAMAGAQRKSCGAWQTTTARTPSAGRKRRSCSSQRGQAVPEQVPFSGWVGQ